MLRENLELFCKQFDEAVQKVLGIDSMKPVIAACGKVAFSELDDVFFQELEMLEPFGHGNPDPVNCPDGSRVRTTDGRWYLRVRRDATIPTTP